MKRKLTAAGRLIVAADFKPPPVDVSAYGQERAILISQTHVRDKVLSLADDLQNTNVYLKVNSALRLCGYGLIQEIHARGLRVFADLKLFDIGETLATDGMLLKCAKPDLLTTVCAAGTVAMQKLKEQLPDTEVLGVTVLTSLKDEDTMAMYGCLVEDAVMLFAKQALNAKIDGLICSPKEASMLRTAFGDHFSLNTPGIRPEWAIVKGDDQNPERIMTPAKAIKAGADRLVIGRPITEAANRREAAVRSLEEIGSAADG